MLRIVIVPRDTIIVEEGEKLPAVLLKTLLVMEGHFTLIITLGKLFVETLNERFMLSQKMRFQPKLINRLDYGPQQEGKLSHEHFQFFVKRLLEEIII